MQNRYKSSWSQAPAGEPPSLPSPYLPMYTRPRWLRHPCRVGEYPCGGYRQVRVGQTSWYASVRRQLEKQRHVSMVLVQHGSKGEKHRGEERGSEKQGRWGTGGEQETRERARPSSNHPPPAVSSRAVGAVRRARAWLRARACPAAAAVLAWRVRGGGSPLRCRRVGGYVAGRGAGAAARG